MRCPSRQRKSWRSPTPPVTSEAVPGAERADPVVSPISLRARIVGPGRAGGALARALAIAGWAVAEPVRHGGATAEAADGVDLVVVATPDAAIAAVAADIAPRDDVVVAHLSGSLGTDVLAPHAHRAAIHPLASLPDPEAGAERLRGAWFAVGASCPHAESMAAAVVAALAGRPLAVADHERVAHHAAATVAANHLVALLAQVERIAPPGVPLAAYLDMARATIDNV